MSEEEEGHKVFDKYGFMRSLLFAPPWDVRTGWHKCLNPHGRHPPATYFDEFTIGMVEHVSK